MAEYDPTKPFNEQVRRFIEETWSSGEKWNLEVLREGKRTAIQKLGTEPWILPDGSFRAEQDATDGIGTKSFLHWFMKTFSHASQDAFAMVADDLIEKGFVMYKLQDHLVIETDDDEKGKPAIFGLTKGLSNVALRHNVIVTGGETAILDTVKGFEMGITGTGLKMYPTPKGIQEGDIIIGLESSGIHSNGLTFARDLYFNQLNYNLNDRLKINGEYRGDWTIGDELTVPTKVYMNDLCELLSRGEERVHGLVHITGGGWSKLHELDPNKEFSIDVNAEFMRHSPIFMDMYQRSQQTKKPLTNDTMYKKFNCGMGYAVAIASEFEDEAMAILQKHDPVNITHEVRKVAPGSGYVKIRNPRFNDLDQEVIYR